MQVFRRPLLVLIAPFFVLMLYLAAMDYGIVRIVGDPGSIKKVLASSGIYDSVLTGLLDESKAVSNDGDSTSLQSSTIKVAAEKAITPQFIQTSTETVIDSVYRWLDGTTTVPDFKIDLTATKDTFALKAGEAVTVKLASLPACAPGSPVSAQVLDVDTIDSVVCLPIGVSPQAEGAKVEQNIKGGEGFLDHPVFTAADLDISRCCGGTEPTTSIYESDWKNLPEVFQVVKVSPYAIGLLALLLGVVIVFLSSTRRKGLRRVGISILIVGILTLAVSYSAIWAVNDKAIPNIKLNNAVLQDKVRILAKDVNRKITTNYLQVGTVYILVGVGLIAGTLLIKPGSKTNDDLEGEGQTAEDRIELKEPVKATPFDEDETSEADEFEDTPGAPPKPKKKPAPKPTAKRPDKPATKKIIIQ